MTQETQTKATKANTPVVNYRQLPPALRATLKPYPEDFHMLLWSLMSRRKQPGWKEDPLTDHQAGRNT